MVEHNHMADWMQEIRRGKALQEIVTAATITDEAGASVDLENLNPDGSLDTEAQAEKAEAAQADADEKPAKKPAARKAPAKKKADAEATDADADEKPAKKPAARKAPAKKKADDTDAEPKA